MFLENTVGNLCQKLSLKQWNTFQQGIGYTGRWMISLALKSMYLVDRAYILNLQQRQMQKSIFLWSTEYILNKQLIPAKLNMYLESIGCTVNLLPDPMTMSRFQTYITHKRYWR